MAESRQPRTKRGTFVINLVQTPNGYSLVQGSELLNKPSQVISSIPMGVSLTNSYSYSSPALISKENRVVKRLNLSVLKNSNKKGEQCDAKLVIPLESTKYAQWFDINKIDNREVQMVVEFLMQQSQETIKEIKQSLQYRTVLSEYRCHRNQIVKLYYEEYAPSKRYLTTNQLRKYICTDAYWLMRIHIFLTSWGIINSHHINFHHQFNQQNYIMRVDPQSSKTKMLNYDLTLDQHHISNVESDNNSLLKKLTTKIRPFCDYCGIHCGIVWFQHLRFMDGKQILMIMKNVNSKNPPLSNKEYEIILCTKCYCDGNFPLLLTHHDFKKISVNDRLQPNKKKKQKRRKDKSKKKRKERQEDEIDEKEYESEHQKTPQKEQQPEKKIAEVNVSSVIETIICSQEAQKKWTPQETLELLSLIQLHGEQWGLIHQILQSKGYCSDKIPEQIIGYFLNLPKVGISKIQEQYNTQQFMKDNFHQNRTNIIDKISEKALEKAQLMKDKIRQQMKTINQTNRDWKNAIDQFTEMFINRNKHLISDLEKLDAVSKQKLQKTQEYYKKVALKNQ